MLGDIGVFRLGVRHLVPILVVYRELWVENYKADWDPEFLGYLALRFHTSGFCPAWYAQNPELLATRNQALVKGGPEFPFAREFTSHGNRVTMNDGRIEENTRLVVHHPAIEEARFNKASLAHRMVEVGVRAC